MSEQFEASIKTLYSALELMETANIQGDEKLRAFNLLSDNYFRLGEVDQSIFHASQSLKLATDEQSWKRARDAILLLSRANEYAGNYREAFENQKQLNEINGLILNDESLKLIKEFDAKFSLSEKENEIALLNEENKRKTTLYRAQLIIGILILVLTMLAIRSLYLRVKNKERKLEIERLRKNQLKTEINHKNKQLVSKSLSIVQKKELLNEIQKTAENTDNTSVSRSLTKISNIVDYSDKLDKEWDEFRIYFEEANVGFYSELKSISNELTPNDLKLSALLKLNLSNKEISSLLNITVDGVKKARYRLRKKLNLTKEENLVLFMQEIEKNALPK
jgi:DNA-binding CsgD family transcriptional regulator/predicted nucleic acid-binding Zn ribbon protein